MISNKNLLNKQGLPWHVVEQAIREEEEWLRNIFQTQRGQGEHCDLCFNYALRLISLEIVKGRVRVQEFNASANVPDLWEGLTVNQQIEHHAYHGGSWHRKMMGVLEVYFESYGYNVEVEPHLSKGRGDLGVYKEGERNLYIEVGTVMIHKFWQNLVSMGDALFLVVPDERNAYEFRPHIKKTAQKIPPIV
jgi:hypothetical protein